MTIIYTWSKTTPRYEKFIPIGTEGLGIIVNPIYLPKGTPKDDFPVPLPEAA